MATITPSALVFMQDAEFTVESDDYAAAISAMALTPSFSNVNFKGLKSTATYSASTAPTWTCDITFAQDEADDSLSIYLFDNAGDEKTVTFTPKSGGRPWTVDVVIQPGAIGGAVDGFATATVSMAVIGQPTKGALPGA